MKVTDVSKLTTRERTKLFADFGKELSVMKTLAGCPRVVRMFGYCEMVQEQQLVLLMELAPGGTVANLLQDKSVALTDLQKGIIIHEAAMGMEFLIEHGVLHRDLKSFNLLMDKDGHVMVGLHMHTMELSDNRSSIVFPRTGVRFRHQQGGQYAHEQYSGVGKRERQKLSGHNAVDGARSTAMQAAHRKVRRLVFWDRDG